MDYNLLGNLEFCKQIVDELTGLLYYTHVPPTVIALLVGAYVFFKNKSVPSARWLFALCVVFALWTTSNLFLWMLYDSASIMMFLWSLIGVLSTLLFAFTFFFIYSFVTEKSVPPWLLTIWGLLALPVLLATPTTFNLEGFDIQDCVAIEGTAFIYYYHGLGIISALAIPFIPFLRKEGLQTAGKKYSKIPAILAVVGAEFFLVTFLVTSFLSSYLVEAGILSDYSIEQYGIVAMAIFMAFLGYLIVQYRAFDLKVLGAQALVLSLIILIASQYLFVQNVTNRWLITTTLFLTVSFGIVLIHSVQREVAQRERIEKLASELEKANKQQTALIHFITHQLKGFMAKSRGIFSMVLDGDFGTVPETMKPLMQEGFASSTKGAQTIQEILNASNIKSGKVTMAKDPCSFTTLLTGIINTLKPAADAKGIVLTPHLPEADVTFVGDRMQMENALRNLIDNSIKYTPKGSIDITLSDEPTLIRLTITDTGVGITPEDMQHLFTEGGHGAESRKVNVESTGFGLYIVKNIIEAHGGKVWAASEGAGKGATFTVELPKKTA